MFASESAFGLLPDVITSAKGITSGYVPLGASIFSDEIYEVISSPDDPLPSVPGQCGFCPDAG